MEVKILIGPPCSGKSTWIANNNPNNEFIVCSTDNLLSWYGAQVSKTYNEVFNTGLFSSFEKIFFQMIKDLVDNNQKIIIDRTNMTIKSRSKILDLIPSHYQKTAVIFDTELDLILSRNKERSKTGKTIPEFVIKNFIKSYEEPRNEFDKIIHV